MVSRSRVLGVYMWSSCGHDGRRETRRAVGAGLRRRLSFTSLASSRQVLHEQLSLRSISVPEISRFFGIIIRMFYDEHNPPHFHAEYSGSKALFDFEGNVLQGNLSSRTATKLVREWIDLHVSELEEDWKLARESKEIKKIEPLK